MTVSLFLFVFTASRLDSDGLKKMGESEVLTLSTIHGAKGLEFSHVWLVQMAEVCTICMRERERERERERRERESSCVACADGRGMYHLYLVPSFVCASLSGSVSIYPSISTLQFMCS